MKKKYFSRRKRGRGNTGPTDMATLAAAATKMSPPGLDDDPATLESLKDLWKTASSLPMEKNGKKFEF